MAEEVYVPDVRGKSIVEATKTLKTVDLLYSLQNNQDQNAIVVDQMPKPGVFLAKNSMVMLYVNKEQGDKLVSVPNINGYSVQGAIKELQSIGLNIRVVGVGNAIKQSKQPGEKVPVGSLIEVEFKSLETH
jgi:stage V sporulation protein D (sporulation-specific penicillin-binding protein)